MNKEIIQHEILEIKAWRDKQVGTPDYLKYRRIGKEAIIELIPHLAAICESQPDDEDLRDQLSDIMEYMGYWHVAMAWLTNAETIDPNIIINKISKCVTHFLNATDFMPKVKKLITILKEMSVSSTLTENRTQGAGPAGKDKVDKLYDHSEDFTSVLWYGKKYVFKKGIQAAVVKALWEAWEAGTPTLSEETIGEKSGSAAERFKLRDNFRNHPAIDKFIVPAERGCWKLDDGKKNNIS